MGKKTVPSGAKQDPDTEESKRQSLVRRYYPVFESLILFMLDYAKWWRAFQSFVKEELDYRTGLVVQTLVYFILGAVLLCFSLIWILLGCYFWLKILLDSQYLAAFSVGGIFLVISFIFFQLMLKFSRKIFDAKREEEDLDDELDSLLDP